MTELQRRTMNCVPATKAAVEQLYQNGLNPDYNLRLLCISHERLRVELETAQIIIEENNRRIASLQCQVDKHT